MGGHEHRVLTAQGLPAGSVQNLCSKGEDSELKLSREEAKCHGYCHLLS